MDARNVRMILTAIAENNSSQFESHKPAQAVTWLKQRIRIQPNDKGRGIQHDRQIEGAARAAEKAVALFRSGKVEEAKPFALEALKALGSTF